MHIESRFDARPIKHTGKRKKPLCGDSRHDLNYPEIPNSWNNKEKTNMANFNEKINSHKEFVLRDMEHDYFIRRIGSMTLLKLEFGYNVNYLKSGYRLFIQYKDTCRVQKLAGRCFMWACTSNTSGISDVRRFCLDLDVDEDIDNVGNPIFNSIAGAVLISEKGVITYGDTWFEAVDLEEKHVVCDAYICGRMASVFRIPFEAFDLFFGLKENFPKQYEKVFGKTEEAKPVRVETLENDKIYDAYEIACLMDSNRLCSDLVSSLIRLIGCTNSHYVSKDIYEKSQVARKAVEDLAIELVISICNIENRIQ